MNKKRWLLTAVAVTIVVSVIEAIGHSVFLGGAYAATSSLWRPMPDMHRLIPFGWFATFVVSLILVQIYHRGYEGKGSKLAEGLRFGLVIGLFVSIPMAVWTYISFPITPVIPFGWFVIGMIDMLAAGAIVGIMHKPGTGAETCACCS